jgi:hypothetical protein
MLGASNAISRRLSTAVRSVVIPSVVVSQHETWISFLQNEKKKKTELLYSNPASVRDGHAWQGLQLTAVQILI